MSLVLLLLLSVANCIQAYSCNFLLLFGNSTDKVTFRQPNGKIVTGKPRTTSWKQGLPLGSQIISDFKLANGVIVNVPNSDSLTLNKLKLLGGVEEAFQLCDKDGKPSSVKPSRPELIPDSKLRFQQLPNNYNSLIMMNVTKVWPLSTSKSNSTKGQGTKICIIDSGVDYSHPVFGSCKQISPSSKSMYPCPKVFFGYDVNAPNGGTQPGNGHTASPFCPGWNISSIDVYSTPNHGTHVAGIAAGNNDVLQGIAPLARIGAYKVANCQDYNGDPNTGVTFSVSSVFQASEKAVLDGCDVINYSLGTIAPSYGPYVKFYNRLMENSKSVFVGSAGNEGEAGLFKTTDYGSIPDFISVASADTNPVNIYQGIINDGVNPINFNYFLPNQNAKPPVKSKTFKMIAFNDTICKPLKDCSLIKDKFVLVPYHELISNPCSMFQSAEIVEKCGGLGTILWLQDVNVVGEYNVPLGLQTFVKVDKFSGQILFDNSKGVLQFTSNVMNFPVWVSAFSSTGPSTMLINKPDIMAVGGQVFSSIVIPFQPYAILDGTSMAAPQVSGAIALLIQSLRDHKDKRIVGDFRKQKSLQNYVKRLLMSTSTPHLTAQDPGWYKPAFRQGAGMLNIYEAVTTPLRVVVTNQPSGEWQKTLKRDLNVNVTSLTGSIKSSVFSSLNGLGSTLFGYSIYATSEYSYVEPKVTWTNKMLKGNQVSVKSWIDVSNPKILPENPWINGQDVATIFTGFLKGKVKVDGMERMIHWPYSGLKGDYNNGMEKNTMGEIGIILTDSQGTFTSFMQAGHVYSLQPGGYYENYPIISYVFNWAVLSVTGYLYRKGQDWTKVDSLGVVYYDYSIGSVNNPLEPYQLTAQAIVDGQYYDLNQFLINQDTFATVGKIPDGDYYIVFAILKPKSFENLAESWFYIETPWFKIDRTS